MRKHDHPEGRGLRWLVAGLAVLAVMVASGFLREHARSRQIDLEIRALRAEAERLRVRNFEIAALESSLSSGEFLEREARMKLGLQKEGEQAVVVRASPSAPTHGDGPLARTDAFGEAWSNPKKWWTYFTDPEAFRTYASRARDAGHQASSTR